MSTLEEHEAEQAAITAQCEAGTCRHPECHESEVTRKHDPGDLLVTRAAPAWAWEIIDETLACDMNSKAFDADTRADVRNAYHAMILACELDEVITHLTRAEVEAHEAEEGEAA